MISTLKTVKNAEFKKLSRPHVVILGAGASRACLPDGDYYGKSIPLMNDLKNLDSVKAILDRYSYPQSNIENFEEFYSEVFERGEKELLKDLELAIFEFFQDLRIIDTPTVYDYLNCSLRSKDSIVTFNWDPLLMQAYIRCPFKLKPRLLFLHGNVSVGFNEEERISSYIGVE